MNAAERIGAAHAALAIRRTGEIVPREEYLDYMTFRANARPLFTEIFGPLLGLKEEWTAQGATPDERDCAAFPYRYPVEHGIGANTGWVGGDEPVILEETEERLVYRDGMGRRMELAKKASTLAIPMTYPVATMDDWLRVRHHYTFDPSRVRPWSPHPGHVMMISIPGGFDEPRQLMGEEGLAVACYEQPELLHAILDTIGDTAFRVCELATREHGVDQLAVHEDMAGRSGPLLGPAQVRTFIAPYYRRIWDLLRERGARLFKQDSDGDMRPVIPAFLDAGINVMFPCEPAAGMDIVALRAQYGTRLAFLGGIDKHVLRRSLAEIDAELEYKIPPMVRTGGCVLGLDHRIPNGTPLAHYRYYIKRAWELLNTPAA